MAANEETKRQDQDSEAQFLLAEYAHEQKRLETSLGTINQTLTIYGVLMGVMAAFAANLVNIFWKEHREAVWISLLLVLPLCAILTALMLFRHFLARMQQTDAERAICRLRRYFVTRHSQVAAYVTGRITDDWPTPYTHRWSSMTHLGWLVLIFLSGLFAGLSTFFLMLLSFEMLGHRCAVGVSVVVGSAYSLGLLLWLNRRLRARNRMHQVRFPEQRDGPSG